MHSRYQNTKNTTQGFGLIEMMVSITIVTLVSAVIISRHNAFNGAVLLRNQAYEVAFAFREAQLLAVSGANPSPTVAQQYGIYFTNTNKNAYIIFRDNNADGRYGAGDTQIGPVGIIDRRFEIRNIYFNTTTAVPQNGAQSNLSITFRRPNFDALFRRASGVYEGGPVYIDIARKGITGTGVGDVRRVEITSTGQVAITTY